MECFSLAELYLAMAEPVASPWVVWSLSVAGEVVAHYDGLAYHHFDSKMNVLNDLKYKRDEKTNLIPSWHWRCRWLFSFLFHKLFYIVWLNEIINKVSGPPIFQLISGYASFMQERPQRLIFPW